MIITCIQCKRTFLFTEDQQREFKARGFSEPRRCRECSMINKKQRSNNTYSDSAGKAVSLSDRYLREGYFDTAGLMRREIFGSEARHVAEVLGAQGLTATRLRSFLNRLQAILYNLAQTNDFLQARVRLNAFQVAAEYARARNMVPPVFCEFIRRNLELAQKDEDSFNSFLEHYKSVVAYARNDKNFSAGYWLDGRGLPAGYLSGGYFTNTGHLRREVLIEWPKLLVETFAARNLTNTALRRFYNKLRALDGKLKGGAEFSRILPSLYAFERDAAYAAARETVPGEFIGFIARNVNLACQSKEAFQAFVEHFQCLIAFGKGRLSEGGQKK